MRAPILTATVLLVLGSAAVVAEEAAEAFDPARLARLQAGEILVEPASPDRSTFEATGLVHAPIERVWQGITDHSHFLKIFPDNRDVVVREKDERHDVLCYTQKKVFTFRYCLRREYDAEARRIDLQMIEGNLRTMDGTWALAPGPEGTTIARFRLHAEVSRWVPATFAERSNRRGVRDAIFALRRWSETGEYAGAE